MLGEYAAPLFEGARSRAPLLAFCCALLLPAGALAQSAEEIREGKVCANCHAGVEAICSGKHGVKEESRTTPATIGSATSHGVLNAHMKRHGHILPTRF